jgi:hypothetical protein
MFLRSNNPAFRAIQQQQGRLVSSLVLDASATHLFPKKAVCSLVNAIRANPSLILAMMATLPSKFLLSNEPRCLNSGATGASPSPILIGGIAPSGTGSIAVKGA